jgi:hypothetical protein
MQGLDTACKNGEVTIQGMQKPSDISAMRNISAIYDGYR